jgi:hypothetical protein
MSAGVLVCLAGVAAAEERRGGVADIFSRSAPRPPRSVPHIGAKVDGAKVDGVKADSAKVDGAKVDAAKADHASSVVVSKPTRPEGLSARSTGHVAGPAVTFPPVAPLE